MTKTASEREVAAHRALHAACAISLGAMLAGPGTASAQAYPSKIIRILTAEAGSNADLLSRLIAQGISGPLGQQVIVDNRGGSVINSAGIVSKAAPDGYNLLVYGPAVWTLSLIQEVPFDPVKDFAPITLALSSMHMVTLHPSVPVKSIKELIALAKAKPGQLNNSSAGVGSAVYFAAELFKSMAGVNIVRIDYKGAASAMYALAAGEVHLMFPTTDAVAPYIKSGRLRALAVTSPQPSPLFPDMPTVAAVVPGYSSVSGLGAFAPAGTPTAIISRLNQEIAKVLNRPEVKEKYASTGVQVVSSSPEEYAAKVKSDLTMLGKVIKDAGVRHN